MPSSDVDRWIQSWRWMVPSCEYDRIGMKNKSRLEVRLPSGDIDELNQNWRYDYPVLSKAVKISQH